MKKKIKKRSKGYSTRELINIAYAAGLKLYGPPNTDRPGEDSGLVFYKEICTVEYTTYEKEVKEMSDAMGDPPEEIQFSDFDYVFFPVSMREPMNVAGSHYMHDPDVYDSDGNCYFYSGEADRVYVMSKPKKGG